MIVTVLCRPDLDKDLAIRMAAWLRDNVAKKDAYGRTDVEFFIWGDHREADA
jgi:hypothetical protein